MIGIPKVSPYRIPRPEELVQNIVNWQVVPHRAVLLIHDMQRFFLRPLPNKSVTKVLLTNTERLINQARAQGIQVAYTAQPGGMTLQQRGLLKDFWGRGMNTEPQDREVENCCAPCDGDWVLTKWRYSAFFNTNFLELIREHHKQQLIICGVYAHIGILATALESFSHDIETFIVSDAVASFTKKDHLNALNYAAQTCACISSTQNILS